MVRKSLPFAGPIAAAVLILVALAAFAAYRDPDLALALFSAWKLCL
jgi:hypothetical protein